LSGRWSQNMTCIPREFYWSQLPWKFQIAYNKTCHRKTQWRKYVLVLQWTWPKSSERCFKSFKLELSVKYCLFFSVLCNWHDMNRPYINYAQRITSKNKWQYKHIYCPSLLFKEIGAKFERGRNLPRWKKLRKNFDKKSKTPNCLQLKCNKYWNIIYVGIWDRMY